MPSTRRDSLTEYVESVEEHASADGLTSFRRIVPVDPLRLDDYLERQSFRAWSEANDNPPAWYERPTS